MAWRLGPAVARRKLLQSDQNSVKDDEKSKNDQRRMDKLLPEIVVCRYGIIRGRGQATLLEMVVPLRRRRNVDGWVEERLT